MQGLNIIILMQEKDGSIKWLVGCVSKMSDYLKRFFTEALNDSMLFFELVESLVFVRGTGRPNTSWPFLGTKTWSLGTMEATTLGENILTILVVVELNLTFQTVAKSWQSHLDTRQLNLSRDSIELEDSRSFCCEY
ncbi:hypothetical protein BDR26DRAFT_1007060 [Obelidium mucronatum]|nr:hypothetical protein BDR26DRAFT_1007060 [Obelidium mucronatum]